MIMKSKLLFKKIHDILLELYDIEFYGKIYRNGQETCITIVYTPEGMYIYGLSGELPRVLRLSDGLVEGAFTGSYVVEFVQPKTFRISDKDLNWQKFPSESGLDIYWLLDPRKLLAKPKVLRSETPEVLEHVLVEYDVLELGLSQSASKLLIEHGEEARSAHFYFIKDKLARLTQKDIPPFQDEITISFSYLTSFD